MTKFEDDICIEEEYKGDTVVATAIFKIGLRCNWDKNIAPEIIADAKEGMKDALKAGILSKVNDMISEQDKEDGFFVDPKFPEGLIMIHPETCCKLMKHNLYEKLKDIIKEE